VGRNTPIAVPRVALNVGLHIDATPEPTGWTNVTPSGVDLGFGGGDNFGASGVPVVDPLDPSRIYAGFDLQGLWYSTNYGRSFAKRNTPGDMVEAGKMWGLAIACDSSAIWACNGSPGSHFTDCLKSIDGGRTFFVAQVGIGFEAYQYHASRTNPLNVIATSHTGADDHLWQTLTGGSLWLDRGSTGAGGNSGYLSFGMTDNTILHIAEGDSRGGGGTRRGTWTGSAWTWSPRSTPRHNHGAHQFFVDRVNGVIYNPHGEGMEVSTDDGLTWTVVGSSATPQASCIVAGTTIVGGNSYASFSGIGNVNVQRAPYLPTTPAAVSFALDAPQPPMSNLSFTGGNGPRGMCVTRNPAGQWVVITTNWRGGLWRLVL
jgi:hypothetical protein